MIEVIPNWHPFLVHFMLALFLTSTLMTVVSKAFPGTAWTTGMTIAALWNLWIGTLITGLTYLAGRDAFATVAHGDAVHAEMIVHATWGTYTALGFLVLAVWSLVARRQGRPVSWLFAAVMVMGSLSLLNTGLKGMDLVYGHGLGVEELQVPGSHGHDAEPHQH